MKHQLIAMFLPLCLIMLAIGEPCQHYLSMLNDEVLLVEGNEPKSSDWLLSLAV